MPKAIFCIYLEATEEEAKQLLVFLETNSIPFYDATACDSFAATERTIDDIQAIFEEK